MTEKYAEYLLYHFNKFGRSKFESKAGTADFDTLREDDTLYLYFQWTVEKYDWFYNLNFPVKPYRDMNDKWYTHRGFLRAWKDIEPFVKEEIMDPSVKKIMIVGYSQGAAIGTLAYEYVWFNRPDLRETLEGYGFGCPRVFWGKLTPELKERWSNFHPILNKCDIVTHVPPKCFGFKHTGEPILIDSNPKGWLFWLDAHKWEHYEEGIRKAIENTNE